jgi:hypothetical protein
VNHVIEASGRVISQARGCSIDEVGARGGDDHRIEASERVVGEARPCSVDEVSMKSGWVFDNHVARGRPRALSCSLARFGCPIGGVANP